MHLHFFAYGLDGEKLQASQLKRSQKQEHVLMQWKSLERKEMRIFPGLEKGAVCIKLHEEELVALLHTVRHYRAVTPEGFSIIANFIQQAEDVIARTSAREYVETILEEDRPQEMPKLSET